MGGSCSAASECPGTPPAGCRWACVAALCEPACPSDAGVPDARVNADAAPADTGARDAEPVDAGADATPADALPADAAPADAAPLDAQPLDAAPLDAQPLDASTPDAQGMDASPLDAQGMDASPADTGLPDAGGGCGTTARAPLPGELVVNEILADPPAAGGDANGDGVISSTDDEFVEIGSVATTRLDLGGVVLSDMVQVRHTFAAGTTLECGQVIVVFSGGISAGFPPNWVLASSGALGLNNTGDRLDLGSGGGMTNNLVSTTYGSNAGNDQAIVRQIELNAGSAFILHNAAPNAGGRIFSPGVRVNGAPF